MATRKYDYLEQQIANRSDPDDSDYDNRRSPAKRKRPTKPSSSSKKSSKKPRQRYRNDSDIDDDDDIESEGDYTSWNNSDAEEEEVEFNERTGRPVRRSAKAQKNLKESSDEEIEEVNDDDDDEQDEDERPQPSRSSRLSRRVIQASEEPEQRRSLVVMLPVRFDPANRVSTAASSRPRRSSRPQSSGRPNVAPSSSLGQRRSSRQAHNEDEPLIALTDSGHHAQVVRAGSATPEPTMGRPTRSSKRMPSTSAIIEASQEDSANFEEDEPLPKDEADTQLPTLETDVETQPLDPDEFQPAQGAMIAESIPEGGADDDDEEEDDDDEGPPLKRQRTSRGAAAASTEELDATESQRATRSSGRLRKRASDESSDFAPEPEEAEDDPMSGSDTHGDPRKNSQPSESSSGVRRSSRNKGKASQASRHVSDDDDDEIDFDELAEEAQDLNAGSKKRSRRGHDILYDEVRRPRLRDRAAQPDYRLFRPELMAAAEEEDNRPAARNLTPQRNRRAAGPSRSLFSTYGPFGGAGGPLPVFTGPGGMPAAGGADSDSSDDEQTSRMPRNIGGAVGMTPTSAVPQPFALPQPLNQDPAQSVSGGPSGMGKVKDKKALADADPLGVDQNVNFDGVGGLDNHINQLKEMVALPLLYPEVFQQFKITPPRGVLFHGPPGTGKTLLARALASSVSQQGRKVTFYMRKGADALSKWVGEAERQLRMLFEEARKNQPSIIFFDEIDGLAPVRSSKQEQIHASIVATLLALMDGMDGRGQVIVIGATNRPDSVDPALRRPGRFDREFYFPLPDQKARRSIIDIHTKGWDPPLKPQFKDQLSELTKGYGGADLRALCTEAALNAVQGTFPQIYKSDQKLLIDPTKIRVLAKDFMISVNKMIPSSERSASSGASPLDPTIEPLLKNNLAKIATLLDDMIPSRPKMTALEEAEYDDRDDEHGFDREMMQQNFDKSRVFRPRLLISGAHGMGQQYLGAAILHKFERLHVQSFDLSVLYGDATRSPEATIVQLFQEVRRHKPSVIYIPNIDVWYDTVGPAVVRLFSGLLRSVAPTDPVLVLGIMELDNFDAKPNPNLVRDIFGYSVKNQFVIKRTERGEREAFFNEIVANIRKRPTEFPDQANRKKRTLPQLPAAPLPKAPEGPSKDELKSQKKADRRTLNLLKILIQPIMDQINRKYRKFRFPIIDEHQLQYLFEEQDPNFVATDIPEDQRDAEQLASRPFELKPDEKGVIGLRHRDGRFFYNLDIVTIEKRLSNGYYKRTKDYMSDIKKLAKDAKMAQDEERTLRANELVANVEVDLQMIEDSHPPLMKQCEEVYQRELERERQSKEKEKAKELEGNTAAAGVVSVGNGNTTTETQTTGPVILGEPIPGRVGLPVPVRQGTGDTSSLSNGHMSSSERMQRTPIRPSGEDVQMADVTGEERGQPTQGSPSDTQAQRSQNSGFMQLARNSQPGDYHNSASTTTSGQKTSDKSSNNTQNTNGIRADMPTFHNLSFEGGSQLPDTQGQSPAALTSSFGSTDWMSPPEPHLPSSQSNNSGSQAMGPPAHRHSTSIHDILNKPQDTQEAPPQYLVDSDALIQLHKQLVHRSSGCTVEQLEQVNAAMMDAVWRNRSDWNRIRVMQAVTMAFNEKMEDIEEMQKIAANSQDDPSSAEKEASTGRRLDPSFTERYDPAGSTQWAPPESVSRNI